MYILDLTLILCGFLIGLGAFLSGKDSLYKLFLGLIIAFLLYTLIEGQIALTQMKAISERDSFEIFLSTYSTIILTLLLLFVPIFGIFFMLHPRLYILTYKKSYSQLLLGILLPFFLVGMLAYLGKESLLTQSETWRRIFDFFEKSLIYQVFEKLPWAIFLLLAFLILYKTLFVILLAFFQWFYESVLKEFFRSWKNKKSSQQDGEDGELLEENDESH